MSTSQIDTVKPLEVDIPKGRFTVVTGVSGSGKTTMVLESLVPALEAKINGNPLPAHIRSVEADGIAHVKLIDATPIGINVRSTVATYAGVHDELRKLYAKSPDAKEHGYKASDFSYNTGSLRCPGCDGTGVVSLDVQFLPDVNIPCPDCRGSRYARAAYGVKLMNKAGENASLPELMDMDVNSAIEFCADRKTVSQKLGILKQLGLGYLTLGEETPSLSGGEAQRLKLASEIGRTQTDSVFVFDEPSIGLHPLDVRVLLGVFQALLDNGATVVVIEHDLDVRIREFKEKEDTSQLLFVVEQYIGKPLTPPEMKTILFFTDRLHFSEDLIDYLIQYCVEKGKKDFRYIEKVAVSWAEEGITSPKQAARAARKYDKTVYDIMKALGKSSNPTKAEADYVIKWTKAFSFTQDIILEACERTVMATDKHRFEYADSILNNWHKNEVHHKADILKLDDAYSQSRQTSAKSVRNTTASFNQMMRSTYDFDALEKEIISN